MTSEPSDHVNPAKNRSDTGDSLERAPAPGTLMIAKQVLRVWTAKILTSDRAAYVAVVRATGMKDHSLTPGHVHSWVATRDLDHGYTEVMTFSLWDSRQAIEAFAGYDIDRSMIYPEEAHFLIEASPMATHYDLETDAASRARQPRIGE